MRDAADIGTDASPATGLVGRERELAALRAWLAAALAGQGRLVLVGGEAGIGKTALAEDVCREAEAHGAVDLVGRCYDLSETPPYGPWAEAFARAPRGDGVPPPPDLAGGTGAASQAALFAQVRDHLAALSTTRPMVLLLDDLHWADSGSLDLLRVLARHLADLPLLLLATYRVDELTRRHPLYQLLPLLVREARAARLDVHALDEAGLRALVAGYALPPADADRLAGYLHGRSEGNPFFAGELLRALAEAGALRRDGAGWALGDLAAVGVPPLLRPVLDARVDRLGEDTRDLLATAAVIGQEAPLAVWRAVAGADEEALLAVIERAAAAGLLIETPDGAGVRFAHALVREALYEGTSGLRRRALHRRAGEALAALAAPDPDAVAYHFRRAGDDRAADWLLRAGERARAAYALLAAADRFEAALALLEARGADAGERARLRFHLAMLRRYADPRRGIAALVDAGRLAVEAGDRALAGGCQLLGGLLRCFVGDVRRGLGELAAGCDALDALAPADRERWPGGAAARGDPRGTLVLWLAITGRYAAALAQAERAGAGWPVPASGRPPGRFAEGSGYGDGLQGLGLAHAALGRPDEARRAYAAARAEYRAVGHAMNLGDTTWLELAQVAVPYRADDLAERRALAAEAEEAWRRASGALADFPPRLAWLPLLLVEGGWAEARGLAEAAAAPGGRANWRHFARSLLAPLARELGDPGLAWRLVREHLPAGHATAPGDTPLLNGLELLRLAAALALDARDPATARAWLAAHDRWLAWSGAVLGRAEGALGWAAYHRAAGDPAAARERAAAALAHASEPRQPLALLAAHRALGELATAAGDRDEATEHLDAALALADACAAVYERALTLLALAELRAATGERAAADAALAEARAILEPLEARPALARADALAARLAASAAPPAAYPAGLSAREVEVLRLVAQGLTDAQVAERLFLSPRTVGQHLRSVYTKLGVSSRLAATRFALDHGLA
ncbi:MAG TPA: AAA family ATPase [Thermomicrobiales bacterium]|nr:AAA family ATPase [Thermomicrobiales bacterium]